MALFLEKINSAPLSNEEFSFEFNSWVSNLVDTLNETLRIIEETLNDFVAPVYTSAEIAVLDPDLADGSILYDSDLDVYVGKENGALVKFTTTAYP